MAKTKQPNFNVGPFTLTLDCSYYMCSFCKKHPSTLFLAHTRNKKFSTLTQSAQGNHYKNNAVFCSPVCFKGAVLQSCFSGKDVCTEEVESFLVQRTEFEKTFITKTIDTFPTTHLSIFSYGHPTYNYGILLYEDIVKVNPFTKNNYQSYRIRTSGSFNTVQLISLFNIKQEELPSRL